MAKFLSNTLKLLFATVLGQVIGVLIYPVLTRLFTPADFGIFQLFYSIVSIIAAVACLSYHPSIVLPKKDDDAAQLFVLCIILIFLSSLITGLFFFLFSDFIGNLLKAPELTNYILLIPVAIICNSVAYVFSYWLTRKDQFGTIAKGNLLSSIVGKAFNIGAGYATPSPLGLILGTIVNDAMLVMTFFKRVIGDIKFLFKNISYERIKLMAIRYKKFPLYNSGSSVIAIASSQCAPFLIAIFFSTTVLGFYSIAHTVIKLPLKLIGNSISQVFFQNASNEMQQTGMVKKIVENVYTRLISLGMFPFFILVIIGPELFSFALGSAWYEAGVYASILSPWIFLVFISTPLMSIFSVLERQGTNLFFNIVLLISRIGVLVVGGLLGEPVITMILYSITGVIFWTWMTMKVLQMSGVPTKKAFKEIFRYFILDLLICSPLILMKYYNLSSILLLVTAAALSIFYYFVIIHRDQVLREGIQKFFERPYSWTTKDDVK